MTTKTLLTTAAILATVSLASAQTTGWPITSPLYRPPLEQAKDAFETALRAYNGSKVRTKAHRDYVLSLRRKYAVEYKRVNTPPPEYDRPYTGNLTIERLPTPKEILAHCPENKHPVGCAEWAKDLSWCKVYIVSDEYIKKQSSEVKKLFDQTYEGILRHELAHCNGWPGDHSRPTATAKQ